MTNEYSNFMNHDSVKVVVNYPLLFNIIIIIVFGLLLFYPYKKRSDEKFLSKDVTDVIKGFSILIIIIHHLCKHTIETYTDLRLFAQTGYIGVAVFLFLSGYGMANSFQKSGSNNFFIKKVVRILLPAGFVSSILYIINCLVEGENLSVHTFLMRSFGINYNDRNYWYITFLLFCYVTFYFVSKIYVNNNKKVLILLFIALFVMNNPLALNGRGNALSFPVGVLAGFNQLRFENFYNYHIEKEKNYISNVILLIVAALISFYAALKVTDGINVISGYIILIVIFAVCIFWNKKELLIEKISMLFIVLLISRTIINIDMTSSFLMSLFNLFSIGVVLLVFLKMCHKRISIFFHFLGKHSLELFLIHGAFMYTYDFILYKAPIEISFFIYIIFIIMCSIFLHFLFEKTNKLIISKL